MNELPSVVADAAPRESGVPPKRPHRRSPEVIRRAARKLALSVAEWCQEEVSDDLIDAIARALRYEEDGYDLAQELERDLLLDPDADLVERLDAATWEISTAEEAFVREWVEQNGIQLDLDIGTVVLTPHGVGPIRGRDQKVAKYTVYIEAHDNPRTPGSYLGTVYPAEQVSRVIDEQPKAEDAKRLSPKGAGAACEAGDAQ